MTGKKSQLETSYDRQKCWGMVASIDVYGCHPKNIKDKKLIAKFIDQLVKAIGMKKHGKAYIERFAEGELEGISAMQFIETSSITIHFDEGKNRAFIDIFSCKFFDYQLARKFCQERLGGKRSKASYYFRK